MKITRRKILGWAAGALAAFGFRRQADAAVLFVPGPPGGTGLRLSDDGKEVWEYRTFPYWDTLGDSVQQINSKDMVVFARPERTKYWTYMPLVGMETRYTRVGDLHNVPLGLDGAGVWRHWPLRNWMTKSNTCRLGSRLDELTPEIVREETDSSVVLEFGRGPDVTILGWGRNNAPSVLR